MDLPFDVPFQAPFTRKKTSTKNLGYLTYQLLSRIDLIISYHSYHETSPNVNPTTTTDVEQQSTGCLGAKSSSPKKGARGWKVIFLSPTQKRCFCGSNWWAFFFLTKKCMKPRDWYPRIFEKKTSKAIPTNQPINQPINQPTNQPKKKTSVYWNDRTPNRPRCWNPLMHAWSWKANLARSVLGRSKVVVCHHPGAIRTVQTKCHDSAKSGGPFVSFESLILEGKPVGDFLE